MAARPRAVASRITGVADVAALMRASAWGAFPELPDRVLRAIAAKAPNTRNSIRACYGVWRAWCLKQTPACESFAAEPREIAQFLQDNGPPIRVSRAGDFQVSREGLTSSGAPTKTYATLQRYLAVLGKLHLEAGLSDPTKDPEVVAVWRVLRRGLSRPKQKAALGLDAIRKAVALLPPTAIGKRNRALLLLAYALMARRSELVALNVENFAFDEDGSATVTFERIKTGETSTSYLPVDIVDVVREWLDAAKIKTGAVFVRLDKARDGKRERMDAAWIAAVFKNVARQLALPDLDPSNVSSHSVRIGATHDLVEDGASDAAIMRDAGWKTTRMVGMYSRGAKAKQGAMARKLGRSNIEYE